MIVFFNKIIEGTVGGGALEEQAVEDAITVILKGAPGKYTYHLEDDLGMKCGGQVEIFIEPIYTERRLYIFGAGHIGIFLAKFALDFGFKIKLFDERTDKLRDLEVAGAELVLGDYIDKIEKATFDNNTYCVIVTPKHIKDQEVLTAVAPKNHAYIGMIGSRQKVAAIRQELLQQGIMTEEKLDQIDMPIGIKFAAETPQEIAISILAKIIDVKNRMTEPYQNKCCPLG